VAETYVWSGLTPRDMAQLLARFERPWWIAGGWAIDLALGRATRQHADMDIALLRGDEVALQRALPEWRFHAIRDGTFVLWDGVAPLELPHHQFWVRRDADGPWDFEILLEDHDDRNLLCRRDHRIIRPLDQFGRRTEDGIPHVALEFALLYKAKWHDLDKNMRDFDAALPSLDALQRDWLADAVAITSPEHPWIARLR
jgi:aminoglycoside-2''-adenylyltransferase